MTDVTRYRLSVLSRVVAAAIGGYAVTALSSVALSQMLMRFGVAQAEAVLAPTIISFLVFAAIVLAVFHARSAIRAWMWLLGAAVALTPLNLILLMGWPPV